MHYVNDWVGRGKIISIHTLTIKDPRRDYDLTDLVVLCQRKVRGQIKTTTVPCEAWEEKSRDCQDLKIGDFVEVAGRFENKTWKGLNQEQKSKNLIVVESIKRI